jgi:hypothetical protein
MCKINPETTMLEPLQSIANFPNIGLILSVLFLLLSLRPINIYQIYLLCKKISNGDPLPEKINNFPVQQTSLEHYLDVNKKTFDFIEQILRGHSCQLHLSSEEINHLYLQGQQVNKYNLDVFASSFLKYKNIHSHFEIRGNSLIKKTIEYPSTNGTDGIETTTKEYRFKTKDKSIKRNVWTVEFNGKRMNNTDNHWSDDRFDVFRANDTLLIGLFTGDFIQSPYEDNNQLKLISSALERFTSIEISNEYLIIKVEQ